MFCSIGISISISISISTSVVNSTSNSHGNSHTGSNRVTTTTDEQVLVCTSTLAWGVNFPAHLVVVKGTEFFDGKSQRYVDFPITDLLQVSEVAHSLRFC